MDNIILSRILARKEWKGTGYVLVGVANAATATVKISTTTNRATETRTSWKT